MITCWNGDLGGSLFVTPCLTISRWGFWWCLFGNEVVHLPPKLKPVAWISGCEFRRSRHAINISLREIYSGFYQRRRNQYNLHFKENKKSLLYLNNKRTISRQWNLCMSFSVTESDFAEWFARDIRKKYIHHAYNFSQSRVSLILIYLIQKIKI